MTHVQSKQKILILGGGYGGMIAAARIARSGPAAEVTLIDARPSFVQRIRLHEALAGSSPRTLDYAPLLAKRGVRFVQGRVESLEPGAQRVSGRDGEGRSFAMGYDSLVVALGSATVAGVPGVAEHALRLNDPAEIRQAHARVRALAGSGGRVLVTGGGLTGIETATELAERFPGLRVTLATHGRLGDGYSTLGSAHFRSRFARLGIEVLENASIVGVEAERAWLADGGSLPFDLCVWCAGFEAPALAREAGFAVDRSGRMVVDPALRAVHHPNVYAVGDAAAATFPDGRPIRMGCVSALPTGAHAGDNIRRTIRGQEPEPFGFAFLIRCISLGRKDGLVQFTEPDDAPREKVLTRWPAVAVKEMICRMTISVVHNELRTGLPLYRWSQSGPRDAVDSRVLPERP